MNARTRTRKSACMFLRMRTELAVRKYEEPFISDKRGGVSVGISYAVLRA
jgi:hypothetical protein